MKKILLLAIIIVSLASCRGDWDYKTHPHDPHTPINFDQLKGVWQVREYNFGNDCPYIKKWYPINEITRNKDYFYFQLLDEKNGVIKNLTDHDVEFTFWNEGLNSYTDYPQTRYNPIDSILNPKKKYYDVDIYKFTGDSLIIGINDYSELNFDMHNIYYKINELTCIRVKQ